MEQNPTGRIVPSAREPLYNDLALHNAFNTADLIIEILRYEIDKLRRLLPHFDIGEGIDRLRRVLSKDTWNAFVQYLTGFITRAAKKVHVVDGNVILGEQELGNRLYANDDAISLAAITRHSFVEPGFSHQWHSRSDPKHFGRYYRSSEDDEGVSVDDELDRLSLPSTAAESAAVADADRINTLEQQLAALQKQMTQLLNAKAEGRLSPEEIPSPPRQPTTEKATIPRVSPPAGPPPPPPPPAWLSAQPNATKPKPIITCGGDATRQTEPPKKQLAAAAAKPTLSLKDVLKDLNNVQLKKVARSPNGTPLRTKFSSSSSSHGVSENDDDDACSLDPAAFIAAALRKKFKNTRLSNNFNNTDTEGDDGWDEDSMKEQIA
jgi:hypothetical protein